VTPGSALWHAVVLQIYDPNDGGREHHRMLACQTSTGTIQGDGLKLLRSRRFKVVCRVTTANLLGQLDSVLVGTFDGARLAANHFDVQTTSQLRWAGDIAPFQVTRAVAESSVHLKVVELKLGDAIWRSLRLQRPNRNHFIARTV
jgi:hypothetical protein